MTGWMKWLSLLSTLMVASSRNFTPNKNAQLYGQHGGRRDSVAELGISNGATGQRILFRRQRGVVTGIITAIALATSTTSAVLNNLDCDDIDSRYKNELESMNKLVADYNFEVRIWKLTAKNLEDTYATTKYMQDRVEWIQQMKKDIEKDVLSIINIVLAKKLDPGNLDVIDDDKKHQKEIIGSYGVQCIRSIMHPELYAWWYDGCTLSSFEASVETQIEKVKVEG